MSTWNESNFEDLELNQENDEPYIDIFVMTDDSGNVYTQVKVSDMIKFLQQHKLITDETNSKSWNAGYEVGELHEKIFGVKK